MRRGRTTAHEKQYTARKMRHAPRSFPLGCIEPAQKTGPGAPGTTVCREGGGYAVRFPFSSTEKRICFARAPVAIFFGHV
jgi:hypothetical protein